MSMKIGIAARDADQRWFWSLIVTQHEWAAHCWDTQGLPPAEPVDAWIALVRRCEQQRAVQDSSHSPRWLSQLTAPTLVLGTPISVARDASAELHMPHLITTHAQALTHIDLLLPVLLRIQSVRLAQMAVFVPTPIAHMAPG